MKIYTLKTIKQTKCYKGNIAAIKVLYPDHVEDFARELMVAANHEYIFDDHVDIQSAFYWAVSPQGHDAWCELYYSIKRRLK